MWKNIDPREWIVKLENAKKKNQSNRTNTMDLKVQKMANHERKWTLELRIQKSTNS
jgi:hypothetical protein